MITYWKVCMIQMKKNCLSFELHCHCGVFKALNQFIITGLLKMQICWATSTPSTQGTFEKSELPKCFVLHQKILHTTSDGKYRKRFAINPNQRLFIIISEFMDLELIVFFARFLLQCCLKQLTAQLQMNVRKIKLRSPKVIVKPQKH